MEVDVLVGFFPALVLLIGMFFLPETPRWLMINNRWEEGKKVLLKVEDPDRVEQTLSDLKQEIELYSQHKATATEVLNSGCVQL